MKTLVLALALLLLLVAGSHAGPNENVVLMVHGNADGVETDGDVCGAIALPGACHELVPTAVADANGVEWFLAVAVAAHLWAPLAFNTVTFGIGPYDEGLCYIGMARPCRPDLAPLENPSENWPEPLSGTSVTWAPNCLEGALVAIYYFGVYMSTGGGGQQIPLGDHYPGQTAKVVSCDDPPEQDPILAFGSMGCFGILGETVCYPDPVERRTWGRIKEIYR